MIILWIDPGTTTIWFALVERNGVNFNLLDYWIFSTTPKVAIENKILEIWTDIKEIIKQYKPEIISVEKLYFTTNIKTWIDVAQARGVIVYEAIKHEIKVLEYTPLQVRKAITSYGQAKKAQLQNAIKILFWLSEIPKPDDAADAIGLAYMGALNSNFN